MNPEPTVKCPLPGLEDVTVTYNLMAPSDMIDTFQRSLAVEAADVVVKSIDGWPEDGSGKPLERSAPFAWRVWLANEGLTNAVRALLSPS